MWLFQIQKGLQTVIYTRLIVYLSWIYTNRYGKTYYSIKSMYLKWKYK